MRIFFAILIACTLLAVLGCSSGSNSGTVARGNGVMQMSIQWPELPKDPQDRFIPRAAQSLVLAVSAGGATLTQTVSRPADGTNSVVTFPNVPAGAISVHASAHPTADGTGNPLAIADAVSSIENRGTTTLSIDLSSTITHVTIDHFPSDINATETAHLLATARNAAEDVVMVLPQPDGFFWKSSDATVATVDQNGVLTAIKAGTVRVTAMERESGVSGHVDLLVKPASGTLQIVVLNGGINIFITPETVSMLSGASKQFNAIVAGVPNQTVLWRVEEAAGGSITDAGVYTAPNLPGTYHVIAASVADETKTARATITVHPARIAFAASDASDNYDIYTILSDGSSLTRVTNNSALDLYPALSTDGLRIAFASRREGKFAIYTMNVDGSNVQRLTDLSVHSYHPIWSPDGTKIVYYSEPSNMHELYIMNSDGTNQVRLTNTTAFEYGPTFTPNGNTILFTSDRDGDDDIYSMNLDGSNVVNLTNNTVDDRLPTCSPDGAKIAFESYRNGNSDLYLMNIDGTGIIQLTNDAPEDTEPTFSPDGNSLVFASTRAGDEYSSELFIFDLDTLGITQLTHSDPGMISFQPSWWL